MLLNGAPMLLVSVLKSGPTGRRCEQTTTARRLGFRAGSSARRRAQARETPPKAARQSRAQVPGGAERRDCFGVGRSLAHFRLDRAWALIFPYRRCLHRPTPDQRAEHSANEPA
jgi:hypothetical protein